MRYSIIFVIIVLAVLIWIVKRRYIVAKGNIYCQMCSDTLKIYETTTIIDKDEEMKLHEQIISGHFITIDYDSSNRFTFFYEMEVILSHLEKRYNAIKDHEDYFREDDWKILQDYHKRINDLTNRISFLEWKEGYRKVE